jgi:hypothetical protein
MTGHRRVLAVLAAAALVAPAGARTGFETLFDGRSLDGWTISGAPAWSVADGIVSADAGPTTFLVSNGSYRDFELRVEFWVSDDANSGVFIRCASRTEISATACYGGQYLRHPARPDLRHRGDRQRCGGFANAQSRWPLEQYGHHRARRSFQRHAERPQDRRCGPRLHPWRGPVRPPARSGNGPVQKGRDTPALIPTRGFD